MPITFVGAGSSAAGNNANLTPALPSGLQVGDLMLIMFSARGGGTIGTPTGWTERWTVQHTSSGINKIKLLYRFYQAGDTAPSVTYTGGANGHTTLAQCFAFRGVDPNNPFDTQGSASSNASQQHIGPISGITPASGGACVIVFGHKADDCTSIAVLSGDGLSWARAVFGTSTLGSDASQVADYAILPGSPVTISSKTFTVTGGAANTGLGVMDSLKPGRTLSASLADSDDPLSSDASVAIGVQLSASDAVDPLSASASADVVANASLAEAADTLSSSATVSSGEILANLDATDASDGLSADAGVVASASLAAQEAADALAAASAAEVAAALSLADQPDAVAASTSCAIEANAALADDSDAVSAACAVALSASLALADQADAAVADASALIGLALSTTDAADALSANASRGSILADLNVADAADVAQSTAAVLVAAMASASDAPDGLGSLATTITILTARPLAVKKAEPMTVGNRLGTLLVRRPNPMTVKETNRAFDA